jgi:DNA-binding PucR family transcriptional regulator
MYDQCKLGLLRASLKRTAVEHSVVPNKLRQIEEYDNRNDTTFAKTLFTYIDTMMNRAETCARLNVHRSTLEYRIERLRDYFGIDLKDAKIVAHIQMLNRIDCG